MLGIAHDRNVVGQSAGQFGEVRPYFWHELHEEHGDGGHALRPGHEVLDRVAVPAFRKQRGDLLCEILGWPVVALDDHEWRLVQGQAFDVHSGSGSGSGRAQGEDCSGRRAEQRHRTADVFDQGGNVLNLTVGGVGVGVTAGTPPAPVVVDYGEVLGEESCEFGGVGAVGQCRGNQDDGLLDARLLECDLSAVGGDYAGLGCGRLLSGCWHIHLSGSRRAALLGRELLPMRLPRGRKLIGAQELEASAMHCRRRWSLPFMCLLGADRLQPNRNRRSTPLGEREAATMRRPDDRGVDPERLKPHSSGARRRTPHLGEDEPLGQAPPERGKVAVEPGDIRAVVVSVLRKQDHADSGFGAQTRAGTSRA